MTSDSESASATAPAIAHAPPGYRRLTPLDRHHHAGLGLDPAPDHRWCSAFNSVFLGAIELPRAALDYPLSFVRDAAGEYAPVAVLGLQPQRNLFVDAQGRWQPGTYLPAYVRRFPFCLADTPAPPDGGEAPRLICVEEGQLRPSASPLFDARGEPTAAWAPRLKLIESMEGARQETRSFVRRLEAFELLVPFDALALPDGGEALRVQGLHRVDERKLNALPTRALTTLQRKGDLRLVYAHLLSLEHFARLLDLTVGGGARADAVR